MPWYRCSLLCTNVNTGKPTWSFYNKWRIAHSCSSGTAHWSCHNLQLDLQDTCCRSKTYWYGRFSPVKSTDADSNSSNDSCLLHCDCEMTDNDLEDSKVSLTVPELMSVDCNEQSATVFKTEPSVGHDSVSSCDGDGRPSRSYHLMPPLVSLRPLHTICTQQQQQQNIPDELPGVIQ